VILSIAQGDVARVEKLFAGRGLDFELIGQVTSDPRLKTGSALNEDVSELQRIYEDAIPRRLRGGD
jgi:selenophosphate synthetase-related protein